MQTRVAVRRIRGLDSIRFLAAVWVAFGHGWAPPLEPFFLDLGIIGRLLVAVYHNLFPAPAAVIVFFVLSGFVIHHAYVDGREFRPGDFYARRLIRILVPMGAAMLLAWPLGVKLTLFDRSILWSLVAELVYYLLYPVFRLIRSRVSWFRIIVAALLGSFAVAASAPMALDYPSFGNGLNWLLGLPCWLLGCLMAESDWSRWQNSSAAGMAELWFIRGSIVVTAMILSVARFHLDLGYPWTLNLFAIGVYFWLRREIAEYNIRPGYENRRLILDPLGKVSYSIYLTHVLSVRLSEQLLLGLDQSEAVTWFAGFLIMTAVAFLFYISVERPSHLFARRIGLLVGR